MDSGVASRRDGGHDAIAVAVPGMVQAEEFTLEGKTVTWIVGFREGGGTDRLTALGTIDSDTLNVTFSDNNAIDIALTSAPGQGVCATLRIPLTQPRG